MKVAILGATGAVGKELIHILEERNFPVDSLKLLASAKSVGHEMSFKQETLKIELAEETAFKGIDLVLSAVESDISLRYTPHAVKAGAVVIDNSSAYRLKEEVPLVVPEVNPQDIFNHNGIIANPNCSTIIASVALAPIHVLSAITRLSACTYQAVSGAGTGGLSALQSEIQFQNATRAAQSPFPYPIAFNVIPQIGNFDNDGHTAEELKLGNEGRKILHAPSMAVNCTCVRVPVWRSHSIALNIETQSPLEISVIQKAISQAKGCKLVDDIARLQYPMPLDTSDQDLVYVGRIRKDLSSFNGGVSLWCCGDQIRKGAATNAIQIAEKLFGL